jgi:hypothetical protein
LPSPVQRSGFFLSLRRRLTRRWSCHGGDNQSGDRSCSFAAVPRI